MMFCEQCMYFKGSSETEVTCMGKCMFNPPVAGIGLPTTGSYYTCHNFIENKEDEYVNQD